MTKPPDWQKTRSTYLVGRSHLDGTDALAAEMEAKWGCGRLRLLVSAELREKFDRQRYLLNQAVWHGDLEDVRVQAQRMANAWRALDAAALASGAGKLDPDKVWEVVLENGTVAAIVPDLAHAGAVKAEGRAVRVYTLAEVGRLLSAFPLLAAVKAEFPGATVTRAEERGDPLDAFHDSSQPLEAPFVGDSLDDVLPLTAA